MMRVPVGSDPMVSGSSRAMAADGPMPGSAPMIWPISTPPKAHQQVIGREGGLEAAHQAGELIHVKSLKS